MIRINFNTIRKPLIIFIILIILSLTVPYLLPATFLGAYLFWIVLSVGTIAYGMMVIGGLR